MGFYSRFTLLPAAADLLNLLESEEDGFADFVFKITSVSQERDLSRCFKAFAKYNDRVVGLTFQIGQEWRPCKQDAEFTFLIGWARYLSLGQASDALVESIAHIYDCILESPQMLKQVAFTAAVLGGDPFNIDDETLLMKLFYESEDEQRYAEVFTNVLLRENKLQIREKDPDYRLALLKALTSDA